MDTLTSEILALVQDEGYLVVGVVILASSIGAPLPAALVILVAGSLAAVGGVSPLPLFLLITASSVAGDSIGYLLGQTFGNLFFAGRQKKPGWLLGVGARTSTAFERWSGLTVFLTRWLFTPFSSAVNLLAGVSRYPFRRFRLFAMPGEALSAALFLAMGYAFGVNARYLWDYFDGLAGIITSGVVGLVLVGIGVRWLRRSHAPTSSRLSGSTTQE